MRLIIAGLVILLVLVQVQVWQQVARVSELEQRVVEQREHNEGLLERNRALAAEVTDLRAGLDAVEERARAELGLIGQDEEFYLVVEPEDLSAEDLEMLRVQHHGHSSASQQDSDSGG